MTVRTNRLFTLLALVSGAAFAAAAVWLAAPYPVDELASGYPESRRLFARDGRLLREVVGESGARAEWVGLEDVALRLVDATVAAEDKRFWTHDGVDVLAIDRAVVKSLLAGRLVSGASTITMQLVKLAHPEAHRRTVGSKLAQVRDALALERRVSKRDILEQYLNRAYYGAGALGVQAASERYFGKPAAHLSLAEATLLAGLPRAPSSLNPFENPEGARERQGYVLERMLALGMVSEEEAGAAEEQPLGLLGRAPAPAALHFTDYALTRSPPPGDVRTTLDLGLQEQLETLVREHVAALSRGGLTNAAVVVLDNRDCEVLAMVGSADYRAAGDGEVNGAVARRQPGSALKPFTYALGFELLYTPATVVADVPTQYLGHEGLLFRPRNYNERHSGPVLMAEALGRSLNVPAIRIANALGPSELLNRLHQAGFASLDQPAEHYGLGLTLGNGEVTLLELAAGYAAFARRGESCAPRVYQNETLPTPQRVFSEQVSFLITAILADEALRVRAFGAANPLLLGYPMAVKTGTSSNWRDSWAIGYTERHTVAVWSGDFGGEPMQRVSGAAGAGPLFHRVADRVVEAAGAPPEAPRPPAGVEQRVVCALSGMAPTPLCTHTRAVWVEAEAGARPPCTWHQSLRLDRRNGLLAGERCPARHVVGKVFEVLPPHYAAWQAEHASSAPPTAYSPLCPADGPAVDALVITSPRPGEVFLVEPGYERRTQTVQLAAEINPAPARAWWRVDGERVARAAWPYEASWPLAPGRHRVEIEAGGKRSEAVEFEVR